MSVLEDRFARHLLERLLLLGRHLQHIDPSITAVGQLHGFRLDAIPYLIERDGTSNENLPETHAVIRRLRAAIDAHYPNRFLLAEANMWPEDVREYFGEDDECHMAYHFPLMPRIFMAVEQEDRHPITEILSQTPDIPDNCQWALFLRNHDELTLEMVTDEERDYMYRVYAADPQARINVLSSEVADYEGKTRPADPFFFRAHSGDCITLRVRAEHCHLFDSSQPDFDWTNPWVHEQFIAILNFWLDKGIDGFRVEFGIDSLSRTGAAVNYANPIVWDDPDTKTTASNRGDAMPDGGKLVLTTRNVVFGVREAVAVGVGYAGDYVEIEIADPAHATRLRIAPA